MSITARRIIIALAAIHILLLGVVVLNRLSHKAIDSNEATDAHFAYEFGEGMNTFGEDDLYVQQVWYYPLIYQVTGFLTRPFGYDIRAMRTVALFFGLGSILLVGLIVYRQTGSRFFAFVALALMSGIDCGHWYMDTSPNAAHVFFALLAIYLLLRRDEVSWPTVIMASVSLYLSLWAKQTGIAYIAAGVFFLFTRSMKKGLVGLAVAGGLTAITLFYYATRPNSSFMEMTMSHANHPMMWQWLWERALYPELFGRFAVLIAVIAAAVFMNGWNYKRWLKPDLIFLGAATVVGLVARCKYGSGPTQAILFYGMIIICGISFLHSLLEKKALVGMLAATLLGVQSLVLLHGIGASLITADDDFRFQQILDILATPGKTAYYVNRGFLNVLVGKRPYANVGRDCWYKHHYDKSRYPEYFRRELSKDPFDIVIIDVPLEDNSWFLYQRLNENYKPVREIPASGKADTALRFKKVVLVRKDQLTL